MKRRSFCEQKKNQKTSFVLCYAVGPRTQAVAAATLFAIASLAYLFEPPDCHAPSGACGGSRAVTAYPLDQTARMAMSHGRRRQRRARTGWTDEAGCRQLRR